MRIMLIMIIPFLLYTNAYSIELELDINTIPDRLVSNTDAILIIKYKERDNITPFIPEIENILSSDNGIMNVDVETLRIIGNNLVVNLDVIKSGEVTITVIPREGKPISKRFNVGENNYIPTNLLMKIRPESFSHIGPYKGYITIELVNAQGFPVIADDDYIIDLISSNSDLISLDSMIISKGSYFGIKEFNINGYGKSTIIAKYRNLITESNINIEDPYKDLNLKLYIAPNIAPAIKGQKVYAFVQLENSKGELLYAKEDIAIEIKSFTDDIITKPALLKAGESTAIAELIINDEKRCTSNSCIEVYATMNNIRSNSAFLKLTDYIRYNYMESREHNNTKIVPILFPKDMPILADGKEKIIGVVQLMGITNESSLDKAKPIVPMHTIFIESNSKDLLNIINNIIIEKPYSTALVKARAGYLGGDEEIELFGDRINPYKSSLKLYGHRNINVIAEPMIDKIKSNTNFPYIIYFKNEKGEVSYAPEDLNMMISMNNKILSLESKYIKRGSANLLLTAHASQSGETTLIFDLINYKTTSNLTILEESSSSLLLNIPDKIIKNSKVLASIQVVDSNGLPISLKEDLNVYLYPSNGLINIPRSITIPAEMGYATFLIEAYKSIGITDLNIFIDNSKPYSKSIDIIDDNIKLIIEKENELKINEQLTLILKAYYNNQPLDNAKVIWDNTRALPIEYDRFTTNGSAKARYLIKDYGEHIFNAKISYKGIEREGKIVLNSIEQPIMSNMSNTFENPSNNTLMILDKVSQGEYRLPLDTLPIKIEYILLIPAIAGIAIALLKMNKTKVK